MKAVPHDGLEVGKVVDDDFAGFSVEHLCRCNCGEAGCHDRVWRAGEPSKCAVCRPPMLDYRERWSMSTRPNECGSCGKDHGSDQPCSSEPIWEPKPDEPGYWNSKLAAAITEEEIVIAYHKHRAELEQHGGELRPFDVLSTRILGRFGQYLHGDSTDDPRREDAVFVLKEIQRYLLLTSLGGARMNAASAIRSRTVEEIRADVACVGASLLGFERSRSEFTQEQQPNPVSSAGRMAALRVDLECTGMDDHDPAPCPKCERIREQIGKAYDEGERKARRNKSNMSDFTPPSPPGEDFSAGGAFAPWKPPENERDWAQ